MVVDQQAHELLLLDRRMPIAKLFRDAMGQRAELAVLRAMPPIGVPGTGFCNDLKVLPPSSDRLKFKPPTKTFSGFDGSTRIWL